LEYKRHCYKYLGIQYITGYELKIGIRGTLLQVSWYTIYPRELVKDWNIRDTVTSILVYNISQKMSSRLEYKTHCYKYLGIQYIPENELQIGI